MAADVFLTAGHCTSLLEEIGAMDKSYRLDTPSARAFLGRFVDLP